MWYIILFFATLFVDQISKIICDAYKVNIPVLEGILKIDIAYNKGASFSFLSNVEWAQTFFILLTVVVLAFGVGFIIIKKPKSKWLNSALALMFSGTIGNFIDRLAFRYVRDFINVPFFANFNVADICLCIGAFMLIFYVLFMGEDPVFNFKKNKNESKGE
ncbi:MAG: signal peptidase II [Clostridiales bacterium]|nr:signal peptidase II [Clostridiales bacterium]